ncbi:MAG: MAPEG family protein [Gammaproteobacteria bacterium]|nr:MAPEG family protein [Gammaproteobacteria bacterium]
MQILYPSFVMMALTIFCMVRLGLLRWAAVSRGEVDPRFFSLYRGYEEPEKLAAYSRHVVNLFEAPLLFYVIIMTAFVTGQSGSWLLGLAWAYVALRFFHSYVHLTSNVVLTRFRIFVVSMLTLSVLWVIVLTNIMRQGN